MESGQFMREALKEAEKALSAGEVPVGAVIEKDGVIIGRGHNLTETSKDPTAHAEMAAIRDAAGRLGGWRLSGCRMYVTAEPCAMCAGALVLARIEKVFIGAADPKTGACGSLMNIPQDARLNHHVEIETGIMRQQCGAMMKSFFQSLREQKHSEKKSEEHTI
jgi:tRNA(adenine34) deaminase